MMSCSLHINCNKKGVFFAFVLFVKGCIKLTIGVQWDTFTFCLEGMEDCVILILN